MLYIVMYACTKYCKISNRPCGTDLLTLQGKLCQGRSHGNNVDYVDVIIAHVISADAHTDAENAK